MEPVAAGGACSWCYSQGIDKPDLDLSLFIKATAMGWVVPRTLSSSTWVCGISQSGQEHIKTMIAKDLDEAETHSRVTVRGGL